MERGGSAFGFAVVEILCVVFVTVVRSQVEIHDEFHLLWKHLTGIFPEKRVSDASDGVTVELDPKVIEDIVARVGILAVGTRGRLAAFQYTGRSISNR
jgi:hypothetical protein